MIIKDRIIYELQKENYLSDRELTDRILGINVPQQSINQACRNLENLGKIKRTARPIRNYIFNEIDCDNKNILTNEQKALSECINKELNHYLETKSEYLKNEFNEFWNAFWKTKGKDYFSEISLSKVVDLKMSIRNINNLITNEITKLAVKKIGKIINHSESDIKKILDCVESKSANSNGYDIEWGENSAYVCEVKANIPVKKIAFGAAQADQIVKDFNSLINGKTKSSLNKSQLDSYYKFMCFYGTSSSSLEAVNNLISKIYKDLRDRIVIYKDGMNINKKNIYCLFIDFEENDKS